MGAIIGAVISAGVAVYGAYQTSQTNKGNQQAYQDSREDYAARIQAAQDGLAQVEAQFEAQIRAICSAREFTSIC